MGSSLQHPPPQATPATIAGPQPARSAACPIARGAPAPDLMVQRKESRDD